MVKVKNIIGTGIISVILLSGALSACAAPAKEDAVILAPAPAAHAAPMPFMTIYESANDFTTTLDKLTAGVDARGLKTFAVIDHAKGAASIDQALAPTTLVIFGNPKGGTPLMQAAQTMGFDLPLKALVYEDADGAVKIGVSDIAALFAAHSDAAPPPPVSAIGDMLKGLAAEAGS